MRTAAAAYQRRPNPRCRANGQRLLIGLANFGLDDADDFALVVPAIAQAGQVTMRVMDRNARWRETRVDVQAGGVITPGKPANVPAQSVRVIELRLTTD